MYVFKLITEVSLFRCLSKNYKHPEQLLHYFFCYPGRCNVDSISSGVYKNKVTTQ